MSDTMKILPATTSIQFLGDGVRTEFQFPFGIFSADNVEVYVDAEKLSSGYTVSGVGESDGGSVSFLDAPASAAVITIRRSLSIERVTDFQESSELRAAALNKDLDYLTACVQQINGDLSRCISLTPTDVGASLTLPPKSSRSDKLFGFDADGNVIVVDPSLVSGTNGWKSLDDIPEGLGSLHFTPAEKSKLETVQPHAAPNPVQATSDEKSAGSETQPRSLSPRDVRDMIQTHAPAVPATAQFFPPVVAGADSNHIVTLSVEQSQKAIWVQAFSAQAPVTVRVASGLPNDFACQIVNDTDFPLNIVTYGVDVEVVRPNYTLPVIAGRHERAFLTPTPTPNTWSIDGDLVLA